MSQQTKPKTKLQQYQETVSKKVQLTLHNLLKSKQDQTESLGQLFNSLKKSVLRQIQRTYKKFLSAIEQKIGCLQSSLIEANQEIIADSLDVFTLQNVYRFTKRIQSQSDKYLISKFRMSIQKLQKSMIDFMKDIDVPSPSKINFQDNIRIQKVKSHELDSKPLGLDIVNDKLMIWGADFYNYDGRDKQSKTSQILQMKSVRLYEKDYLLIVHKDYLEIEQPKTGVLMDRIEGNFQKLLTIVSTEDLVYFIKSNSIMKLNLDTGKITTKQIPSRVLIGASKTLYMNCLAVSFKFGQVGLFNSHLDLIWVTKYPFQIQFLAGTQQYLIASSKSDIYVNCLNSTIFKKQIGINSICMLNNHNVLILNNQAQILNLITLEMKDVKFKWNKKTSNGIISDGNNISMIVNNNNNQVTVFKIE